MADAVGEEAPAKRARKAHYFGDTEMSDVVFIIGDDEFHANRTFLAVRSAYFKQMFAGHPPAEEGKLSITLDEDVTDFKYMMNMIYKGFYGGDDEPKRCQSMPIEQFNEDSRKKRAKDIWLWLVRDVRLAEKFKVVDVVRPILERYIIIGSCEKSTCVTCAAWNLLGLHYNWKNVIMRMVTSEDTLTLVLTFLATDAEVDLPVFHIAPVAFSKILDGIVGGTSEKFELPNVEEEESAGGEDATHKVFKYGRANVLATDVVLAAKNSDFHVHKHFLALNSPVFTAMFFSEFKEKSEEKLSINDDEVAFKGMLDLLYDGQSKDDLDFLTCDSEKTKELIIRFWDRLPSIIELFDYYDLPYRPIEDRLCLSLCGNVGCVQCANKKLFSMHYNLQKAKERIHCDPGAVISCIRRCQDILPVPLHLTPLEVCDLIKIAKEL